MIENRKFWEQAYQQNIGKMIGICCRYVENHQIALDLTQDAFLTAVEKSSSYKGRGPFGAWLRTITINTALQHLRESRKKNLDYLLQNENQIKSEDTLEEAKDFSVDPLLTASTNCPTIIGSYLIFM